MNTLTIAAVVISSIVVLVTLGKISRQLDRIIGLFKSIDKKLKVDQTQDDLTSSQIQCQLHKLEQRLKTVKGDVDWKG